jgi:hypothetical protein
MRTIRILSSRALHAAAACVLMLGLAGGAQALTLAQLTGGASFTTSDGTLTFHDFQVTLPATVGSASNAFAGLDLSIIEVEALPSVGFGFKVLEFDAPLVVAGDQIGQMVLAYQVTANPIARITGVGLRFTGTAIGTGASTRIDETVSFAGGSAELHAMRVSGGTQDPDDSVSLPVAAESIGVEKTITLDVSGRYAQLAQLSEFEQRYSVAPVPEPGAFMIFGGSLALIMGASRRRLI